MECTRCERGEITNRVVVDSQSERILGGFCRDCEEQHFGQSLRLSTLNGESSCKLCKQDGHYALPDIDLLIEREQPERVLEVEYTLTDATPGLCFDHLTDLFGEEAATLATPLVRVH